MPKGNCEFNGSGRQYLELFVIHIFLLSMVTLGIYSPWAWVRLFRLRASHTLVNGKPVTFTGTGGKFLVIGLVNGLLTVITFGIYWPWALCRISKWKAQHTLVDGKPSGFVGTGGSLFLFFLVHFIVLPALTFGLYYFYGMYRFYAWKEEHFRYGGEKTSFGAGFRGLLQIYFLFVLILTLFPAIGVFLNVPSIDWLSPLIFILVSPWLGCMFFNWQTRGLVVGDEKGIEHFPPVKTRFLWVAILILIPLLAMGAAGFFFMGWIETQMTRMGELTQLLEMKGAGPGKSEAVRIIVKRPSRAVVPSPGKKPLPKAVPAKNTPGPGPAKKPSPGKDAREKIFLPALFLPAKQGDQPTREYDKEIEELEAFIRKDSQNFDAYYSRGCLYARKGDLVKAEKDFTRAIEINNRDSDAYYNRGLVLARMKKYALAVKDFDKAIELDPKAVDAYCNRGSANLELGKSDLAMRDYNKALKMESNDADLYHNRGVVYLSKGLKSEAMADFQKAAVLRPRPPSKPPAQRKVETKEAGNFDQIDISNVPVAPFLDEVKNKIDVSRHPTYQKMVRAKDHHRQIVDPFYFERARGKAPAYEFRQFVSTRNMLEIIDWYKKKASPGAGGTGDPFARGGGSYANGPFDNKAANFGVNNGRNFIVLTAMKAPEDGGVTVYLFHYRKVPAQAQKPASGRAADAGPGTGGQVK